MQLPTGNQAKHRREWLKTVSYGLSAWWAATSMAMGQNQNPNPAALQENGPASELTKHLKRGQPTKFLISCTTIPYARFPKVRALQGIAEAGYSYVSWGTTHQDNGGDRTPFLAEDATPQAAKVLGQLCRDMKLTPISMLSLTSPEHKDAVKILTQRIQQAAAAGIPYLVTSGDARGFNRQLWVERLKQIGRIAADNQVLVVITQQGGELGSGKACAEIVQEINQPHIMVNFDAANVLSLLNIDPIPDLKTCAPLVRSITMKDHRLTPKKEDCGPGLGEIDQYNLLGQVSHMGCDMPLCCETVSAPLLPPPTKAEEIDALARRARIFLELVVTGLQAPMSEST